MLLLTPLMVVFTLENFSVSAPALIVMAPTIDITGLLKDIVKDPVSPGMFAAITK